MVARANSPDGGFLRLSVILVTAIIGALCGILYWQTRELRRHHEWVEHSHEVRVQIERLNSSLREAESIQRAMLLAGEGMSAPLGGEFRRLIHSTREHVRTLRELMSGNATQSRRVATLDELIETRLLGLERNARDLRQLTQGQRDGRLAAGVRNTGVIAGQLGEIREAEIRLLGKRVAEAQAAASRLLLLATGGSILALTVLVMSLFLANRNRRLSLRYQMRLAEARDSALDSVKATSSFVASVSHEIRTPMNGVLGAADLLIHDGRLDRGQRELVETIRASGEALLDLINDILDLSKLQAGKMEFAREELSIGEVLDETLALFSDAAGRKRLELTYRLSPDVPRRVRGDARRLRQVLINLVGNAVKFTDRGSVQVEVLSRTVDHERPVLTFRVADTGPGLSEAEQERLFEPFSQVNAALSSRHAGTGLGLAICREIVQRFEGTLGVESREGEGATFWFTVRLYPADAQDESGRLCRGGTLLLVEGRRQTAQAIEQHVLGWGMKVEVVDDLDLMRNLPPVADLCAVVIGQPLGGSWRDAAALISHGAKRASAPCFLLAQPHETIPPEELARTGVDARLRFPFRPSDLYDLLAEDTTPSEDPSDEVILSPANVLLVEDNPINQRVFTRQLEVLGMRVAVCSDGPEGVEARAAGDFDIVLMDCQLPTFDGFEATRRIRGWEAETSSQRVPIIAVTAHVMPGDAEACYQAGMDDYLAKPFDLAKLRRALGRWLAPGEVPAIPAEPDEESGGALFDPVQFGDCSLGDPEEDADLLQQALDEAAARLAEMDGAAAAGDDVAWRRAAHRGVGSCGTIGFPRLAALFRQAEQDPDDEEARAWLAGRLAEILAATRAEVARRFPARVG